jgi:peroxiredoxin
MRTPSLFWCLLLLVGGCAPATPGPRAPLYVDPGTGEETGQRRVDAPAPDPGRDVLVGAKRNLGKAPSSSLTALDGSKVEIASLVGDRALVVVFYRGNWCRKCRKQLGELQGILTGFTQQGANVIAISTDAPEQNSELTKKLGLQYSLYSDRGGLNSTTWGVYSREHDLARPAVFVISKDGNIAYRYVSDTPSDRPSAEEVLKIGKSLAGGYGTDRSENLQS